MKQSLLKKLWLRTSLLVAVILCGAGTAWGQDVVEIGTVEQLKAFRDAVNNKISYAGKTVKLTADLDLSGETNWTPIGNLVAYPGQSFDGIFDGQNHSISNLTVNDNTPKYATAGLFGSVVNGTIKNLTVKNVNITSTYFAGGIVAYTSNAPTIENCHVIGGTITTTPELLSSGKYDNGCKAGGIMGYATAGSTINNCTVEGVTISGYRDLGGIVGYSAGNVTNNTVKNVTVTQDLTNAYDGTPNTIGDIIGRSSGATLSNNNVVKSDPVAQIGETKYETLAEAVAAANEGDVVEIIKAGDYPLPNLSKNVTIEGKADGVVSFTHITAGSVASIPNGATFKNVTFNFGNVNYHGFQHAGTINMEGCTLNGKFFSYGDMNFTNCTFNQSNSDYHMWCYAGNVTYSNCMFTNEKTGKFLNVYNEDGTTKYTVTVNNCKFVNQATSANKAALNVKATCGAKLLAYDVIINECTTEGAFPAAGDNCVNDNGTITGFVVNPLVQVDDRTADGVDNITINQDGKKIYPVNYVAQFGDVKYESLQDALDAAEAADPENIVIDLLDDATLDITAWSGEKNALSIGTANTKSITINGNNHTLNFNQKNSDWNNVATMNDAETKLVLNKMSITSSGYYSGHWKRYNIFFNCAVELNKVTSDKALGFNNDATLNNVTIEDNRSGVYGIWIKTNGNNVTIDNLTLNSDRGIAIKDEDSQKIDGTSLEISNATFDTNKKAAILVTSSYGVDITAGEGINIENVASDKTNLVWVDEATADKYGLVSVSGAAIVPESSEADYKAKIVSGDKTLGYYKEFADAVAAAEDGQTVSVIAAGTYTLPGISKNITIDGAVEGVVFNHTAAGSVASIPNGATFKNVTFNFGNVDYHGFQHAGTINMEGCTLNGKFFSYGDMNFTNCNFGQTNADYHMWCYSGNLTYTDCTFTNNSTGKFLNVYNEDGTTKYTVTVTNCKFINQASSANKAALNVKATSGSKVLAFDVVINNCTTEGAFPAASSSDALIVLNNLVQVDDRTSDGVDNITVTLDGIKIYPIQISTPTIFHDSGTYEGSLDVAIAGEGTIMYKLGTDGEATAYTAPISISATTKVMAWAEKDGVKSDEVTKTFTIEPKQAGAEVADGYYTIQTSDGKYVNVAGRKTVTLASDTKSAGTVIRVSADANGVKVLRSQAVDLPRYAERAMSYVPEIVKEVVNKLAGNVDDPIIGEQGTQLILDKFNEEFDYHLYLEGENNTYRIYGRTPSMKPVVDFYAENKELIDGRLLKVEDFVKEVLQKVVDKVGRGQSVVDMFKVKTIWQNMGGTLTEPTDDASTLKFYEEVLSSEKNVWDFAYQTGMLYWEKVKGYLTENAGSLGDYGKYLEKIPNVRPNFRYYIVPGENGVDIISEGNSQITDASTAWTLTKREGFDITFDASLSKNNGKEMYKTLYVDFAYELPENVKALKVKSVTDAGVAETEEITGVVPAQTPVLLKSTDAENLTKTLTLSVADGAAVESELKGNDWLINKFNINTPALETMFAMLTKLSSSLGNKYEYLKRKNAGTVNNKYFFGLSVPTDDGEFKEAFMNGKIKVLADGEKGLGFYSNFDKDLVGNEVFVFTDDANPIPLTLVGDINRDGSITIADVTALVNIILGKATPEKDSDKYDFDAAYVNDDNVITIADVTALVNIILGK